MSSAVLRLTSSTAAGVSEASHPADVLQDQLHLLWVDRGQHKDEGDNVHTALGDVVPQVVGGQVTLETAAALRVVERVLLTGRRGGGGDYWAGDEERSSELIASANWDIWYI